METTKAWTKFFPKLVALWGRLWGCSPRATLCIGLQARSTGLQRSLPRGPGTGGWGGARPRRPRARGAEPRAATLWPALARWFPRDRRATRSSRQGARWLAPPISKLRGPTRFRHIGCRSRCCQCFLLRLRRALLVPAARAAGR